MKQNFILKILILGLGVVMLFSFPGIADDAGKAKKEKKEKKLPRMFVYKPPMRGAPASRMGGGTRGITRGLTRGKKEVFPVIAVLVPEHTGLTTKAYPKLYWYISEPSSERIEFTLNDEEIGETLIQTNLSAAESGIHCLNLSDYNQQLSPGKQYSWFITIIVEPDKPMKNILAGGGIMRVKPLKFLADKLKIADKRDIPAIYADSGIWYDALDELSDLIKKHPEDTRLKEMRVNLLKQVGLNKIKG